MPHECFELSPSELFDCFNIITKEIVVLSFDLQLPFLDEELDILTISKFVNFTYFNHSRKVHHLCKIIDAQPTMKFFYFIEVVDYFQRNPAIFVALLYEESILVVTMVTKVIFDLKLCSLINHLKRQLLNKIFLKCSMFFCVLVQFIFIFEHLVDN